MSLTKILAAASLGVLLSVSAQATTINDTPLGSAEFTQTLTSTKFGFSNTYLFDIAKDAKSFALTLTATAGTFTSLKEDLFVQTNPTTWVRLQTVNAGTAATISSTATQPLLSSEHYKLVVSAGKSLAGSTYDAAVSVSAVPLPAALPLFAAAIAGLGAFGIRRRKARTA